MEAEEEAETLSEVFAIPVVFLEVDQRSSSLMDAASVVVVAAAEEDQRSRLVAACADQSLPRSSAHWLVELVELNRI